MRRARAWPALAAAALAGCSDPVVPARAAPAAQHVQLTAPSTLMLPETVAVTGVLAPQEDLVLGFQVAGRLAELPADLGDEVAAGALLAALDPRDFRLGLDRARAALASARVRLGLEADDAEGAVDLETTAPVREAQAVLAEGRLQLARVQELVQQSLRPQADLDAQLAAVEVAQSRLQAARDDVRTWFAEYRERQVDVELAHKRAQDARLLAPWPGRVAARHVAPGRFLMIGEAVLTLLRVDPLRLRLHVPERKAGLLALGQAVEFAVDGVNGGGGNHTGTLTRLGAAIDQGDRTLLVEATVANPDGALRPGGFCRARIVVQAPKPVLAVLAASVQSFAGVDRVFTVAGGKAQEALIELGRRQGDLVEVRSGLEAQQQIVTDPRGLVQGAAVVVQD